MWYQRQLDVIFVSSDITEDGSFVHMNGTERFRRHSVHVHKIWDELEEEQDVVLPCTERPSNKNGPIFLPTKT